MTWTHVYGNDLFCGFQIVLKSSTLTNSYSHPPSGKRFMGVESSCSADYKLKTVLILIGRMTTSNKLTKPPLSPENIFRFIVLRITN